jgi:hypothetical protein
MLAPVGRPALPYITAAKAYVTSDSKIICKGTSKKHNSLRVRADNASLMQLMSRQFNRSDLLITDPAFKESRGRTMRISLFDGCEESGYVFARVFPVPIACAR